MRSSMMLFVDISLQLGIGVGGYNLIDLSNPISCVPVPISTYR